MFFFLSKIFLFLTHPFIWILILVIPAYLLRKKKWGKRFRITAILVLIIFSNQVILSEAVKAWEGKNEKIPDIRYDAVVVLGGYSSWNERHGQVDFNQGTDRIIKAVYLYKKNRVGKILLSGGSGLLLKPEEREGIWIRDLLLDIGIDSADVMIEYDSRNTHENAVNSAEILKRTFGKDGNFLLITSATHMRRARACFKKTGLNFSFLKVDFAIDDDDYNFSTFVLPSASALDYWSVIMKEWLGYFVYQIRGYL